MKIRTKSMRSFSTEPWMMHPRSLADLYRRVLDGLDSAQPVDDDSRVPETEGASGVMVIPIRGSIVHHWTDAYDSFGMVTPTEWLVEALDRAAADDAVTGVVLDIDSGGGMAAGTPEAAEAIFRFRDVKPIVAVANSFAASAAYYLGAAASEFYVTPSGEVGSIGTLMMHQDVTKMLEDFGVKIEILRATEAENKARFNPFEPLSDEEREHATMQLDTINARFLADVERFRGMEAGTVAALSGNGRTFLAEAAVAAGLVDGIRTVREVVAEMGAGAPAPIEDGEPMERALPEGAELRSVDGVEVRAVDGATPTLEGTALWYQTLSVDLGGFREEFLPGSFNESLATGAAVVLWQHDSRCVLGRVDAGTAKVWEDERGLHYTATPPDATWARDAVESIRRGDVRANSFGFRVVKGGEKWERRSGELVRTISKAELIEVGPNTFPANPTTSVAVRNDTTVARERMQEFVAAEDRARRVLETAKRKHALNRPRVA